ncbi:MAG: hypothetical protein WBF09_22060, partial [Candidatus Acidiferrum sp.]
LVRHNESGRETGFEEMSPYGIQPAQHFLGADFWGVSEISTRPISAFYKSGTLVGEMMSLHNHFQEGEGNSRRLRFEWSCSIASAGPLVLYRR